MNGVIKLGVSYITIQAKFFSLSCAEGNISIGKSMAIDHALHIGLFQVEKVFPLWLWQNQFVAGFNLADMVYYVAKMDFFKLKKNVWPICIRPNLYVADFDLTNMVCNVIEMDIFQVKKSKADMDMAEFVCGKY